MKNNLYLLGIAIALFFGSCQSKEEKKEFIRPVRLTEVSALDIIEKSYPAVVSADQFSNLAFKMAGPLIAMNVVEGQSIKRGQVVAQIDPRDYALELEARKASYLNALSQMKRSEKLLSKNAVSIQEHEINQTAYINAKSAYEYAKDILEDTKLRAPFDGFVQQKFVENYQRVQTGQKIICLINPDKLQIQFTIPETNVNYFSASNTLFVEFDTYKGKLFKARIKEYVQASPDGSGLPVYLYIDDPDFNLNTYKISVGFSCKVIIKVENNNTIAGVGVPLSAIVFDNKLNQKTVFVYNDEDNTVSQVPVEDSGLILGRNEVVVKGTLKQGDRVVSAGATKLIDGQKVKLLTE